MLKNIIQQSLKWGKKSAKKIKKKLKNILDVEKSVYICTERLRGTQSKTFVY